MESYMILYYWRGIDWVDDLIWWENWDARYKEIWGTEIHEFDGLPKEQVINKLKECFDISQVYDVLEYKMTKKAERDRTWLVMDRMYEYPFESASGKSVSIEEFLKEKREQLEKRLIELWKGKNNES